MKAYVIEHYGKRSLKRVDVPVPTVGDHDLLIEIRAASINPLDVKIRNGDVRLLVDYDMPLVMGNDLAGVVTEVGSKVAGFRVGDEVYARPPKDRIGTFAEFIAVDEQAVAPKPKRLSFEEAASVPLVGLTSYQAMHDVLRLEEGQKILIQAGSGGVGTFAIQLAKTMGAFVATTASEAGRSLVESLGADKVIDYRREAFEDVLSGYDAVFDTLGGRPLRRSFRVLERGGEIVSVAGLPNARFGREYGSGVLKTTLFALATLDVRWLERVFGVRYTYLFMKASGDQLRTIGSMIDAGKIKAVVDRVYPFGEVQAAMAYSEQGRAKGKIVVTMA